jgi:phenylacetate-coenzyme A ligase PaaK-like adenylate-forming protein
MNNSNEFGSEEFSLYSMNKEEKNKFIYSKLNFLFDHHISKSLIYKKMMTSIGFDIKNTTSIEKFPYLPVRLFKLHELKSVENNQIIKTMTSSGTTGQQVSKIYIDKLTSVIQTKVLSKIMSSFIGKSRAPMIIIDSEETVKNRKKFSARTAGILGFSMFGSRKVYALNNDMTLNYERVNDFVNQHIGKSILIFGFTSIVYQHFYKELKKNNLKLNLSNGVLIHGGGWKKLTNIAVDSKTFRKNLNSVCNINRVHDYYGMVEQTGSIHMECENGYLHTSEYSDIIIRGFKDFQVLDNGKEGVIQLISLIPLSYPGHSILTEDLGYIVGEDNCSCGRKGKYFKITGRIKKAELRGCSDTYTNGKI